MRLGGPEPIRQRHLARGKLLPRDRVLGLLDAGAPFLELSALAAFGLYGDGVPGAGMISVVGTVSGRLVIITANDSTVKGGTYHPISVRKHLRAQEIALENQLPCVYMVDSGGAFLPLQSEMFADREHGGRMFFNQARMSAQGIPQVALVMGSCTAGGAYVPAMSDEVVIVRQQGTIFLAGPPLVKAATGEIVSAEELGGGDVHARTSGVADHLAEDDEHALELARSIVSNLPVPVQFRWSRSKPAMAGPDRDVALANLLPRDGGPIEDMETLVRLLGDEPEFQEVDGGEGRSLLTCRTILSGHRIGVLAERGSLDSRALRKAARFIGQCQASGLPVLTLQNSGSGDESPQSQEAMAGLLATVATCETPRITLIAGGSIGMASQAMSGRSTSPRFLFRWPGSRLSAFERELAAELFRHRPDVQGVDPFEVWDREADAYYGTARLHDDGLLDPVETRDALGLALEICRQS